MTDIHVCLVADQNFGRFLFFAVTALLSNAEPDDRLHVHILSNGISQEHKNRLQNLSKELRPDASLEFVEFDYNDFQFLKTQNPAITKAAYGRLLIPDIFPDLEKIVYLDVDIIVTGSLAPLWKTTLDGHTIAAVEEINEQNCPRLTALGINSGRYFNAGVLLIDCEKWRTEQTLQKVLELGKDRPFMFADQDMLNLYFDGNYKALNPIWNAQGDKTRPSDTIVYHYSAEKPWNTFRLRDPQVFWDVAMRLPEGKELWPQVVAKSKDKYPGQRWFRLCKYHLLSSLGYRKQHYTEKIERYRFQSQTLKYFKQ